MFHETDNSIKNRVLRTSANESTESLIDRTGGGVIFAEHASLHSNTGNSPSSRLDATLKAGSAGGLFESSEFRDIWNLLKEESSANIDDAKKHLAAPAGQSDTESLFDRKLRSAISPEHADRIERMISEKHMIEIPAQNKHDASELLKPGANLTVGHTKEITMQDGRSYDLYVPPQLYAMNINGKLQVPTIVALHGLHVAAEFSSHLLENTSGLDQVAEREGVAVIYPHSSKIVSFPPIAGWNVPNRENILNTKPGINDIEEINKMINDVRDRFIPVASKVGFIGHSDGGRMAQIYASERPQDVAFLTAWNTTFMKNDPPPETGVPAELIFSDGDQALPKAGGKGLSTLLAGILVHTNVDDSQPYKMPTNWAHANKCDQNYFDTKKSADGKITSNIYSSCQNFLRVDNLHTSTHAISDWHSLGTAGDFNKPADTTLNVTYDTVKRMMPYLTFKAS